MTNQFNFEDAVKALQSGKKLNGKDGVLTSLIKQLTESALQAECNGQQIRRDSKRHFLIHYISDVASYN